jgi:hypothetical protein
LFSWNGLADMHHVVEVSIFESLVYDILLLVLIHIFTL